MAYYDWLVTGLGILQEGGVVEVVYEGEWWDRLLRRHPKVMRGLERFAPKFADFCSPVDSTCVIGRYEESGARIHFAVDITDSPFVFSLGLLEAADIYFKYQCPKTFSPEGFPLNREIRAPYHPDVLTLNYKIRPAMLGRPLGHGLDLRRNLSVLREWEKLAGTPKKKRIFASFGSITHPPARTSETPLPADYNYFSEPTLLSRFAGRVHHPNQKRARIVQILREMKSPLVDARLWRSKDPTLFGPPLTETEYRHHLAESAAVVNISGLRRSIPYRMADTFLTTGLLATDDLEVRWYRPFEPFEVREIGALGYELDENVDWNSVERTLQALNAADVSTEELRARANAYETKWSPRAFASYFVGECAQTLSASR
jgi:hypothetical protein